MKNSDVLFAILRKSSAALTDYSLNDYNRKFIINMKYNYSKLQPVLRNLIKLMSTDISRFSIIGWDNISQTLSTGDVIIGKTSLIDNKTNTVFIIHKDKVTSNDTIIFKDINHHALIVAMGCLIRAKENENKILKEMLEEEKRLNILSEYR